VLLVPFVSYLSIARLMSPMQLVTILETLVIGIVAWRKDFLPVRFFLVAWLGMAASLLLLILVRLAIIPSTFFNENVFQLGFIVMAVAWSIALADRINLLKTETEKTNRELLSSEHRLTQILEGMPLGVVVYGVDQKPQYLNQRAVEILSSPDKTIRPDIAAGRNLEQAVEHFSFQVSGTNEKYPLEDLPVYHALNGRAASVDNIEANFGDRQIPLEIWASPVRDAAGNVESVVAAFQDISRRKQVETEVKEYRHQLETLVERRTAGLNAINKELRLRLEWFAAMNYVSQIVAQSTDFTKINEKIVEIINNLFTTQDSFIAELDSPSGKLKLLAHSCHSDVHPELTGSFTTQPVDVLPGSILEDGAIIFISRDQIRSMDGPLGIHILDSKVHNIAFVPLWLRDQVLGFLGLELDEAGRTFTHEESNLLSTFSTRIAQLIESARLFEQTKLLVAQEERDRLARDLHDSVTQALFSATLVAEVLPQIWRRDPEQGIQSLERLQRLMRGALAEMRTVLLELRPSVVVQTPLEELLTQLTEAVTSRSGLPFKLFIQKIPLLPEDVQVSFYRIAQEALNNVVKHAQARLVTVSLSETGVPPDENCISGHQVRLEIRDDGVGFYSAAGDTGHLGMNIMRERAAAIQAELSLESQPGYGTLVRLIWCYASKSEDKHE
jgi:signal transduction histidine kinase